MSEPLDRLRRLVSIALDLRRRGVSRGNAVVLAAALENFERPDEAPRWQEIR